jgi:Putative Actinobacterial Holin-X, holin superfamily III
MAILESTFGLLFEKGENYSKTTIELYKLKLAEQSANLVSFLVIRLMILLIFFLVVFMLSIGLSLFIGDLIGKLWLGFLIVSLLNIAISFLLYTYRNQLIKAPITKLIVKTFDINL